MSRSGYSDDCDGSTLGLYRGAVDRALQGKRGQAFLRQVLAVLDAMPVKALARNAAQDKQGLCCTLGAVALNRGDDMSTLSNEMEYSADYCEFKKLVARFGIAESMVREIMYVNDEQGGRTPEARWVNVRAWVVGQIKERAQ